MVNENPHLNSFYQITAQGELIKLSGLAEALTLIKNNGQVWLDYPAPAREHLTVLIEPLGLHPLAIEDCLDDDQIPKMENFPANTFILFNRYFYAKKKLLIEEVDFFLGKNFLITVNLRDHSGVGSLGKVKELSRLSSSAAPKGPDFLLHVILDFIVDEKFTTIETLQDEIDGAEEAVLKDPATFNPQLLLKLRRNLLKLRKSLFHEGEILVKICRRDCPFISENAIFHFRDVYDHLAKFFEFSEMYREMISTLTEMYLTMVNNQMTMAANRINHVMRRLTLITTVFMPLTLLASIGGMSEWTMMTGQENWPLAYSIALAAMVVIGMISYALLKKVEAREAAKFEPGKESISFPP